MRLGRSLLIFACGLFTSIAGIQGVRAQAQSPEGDALPPVPHTKQIHLKHVLVIGQTKGFEHDSISDAMAAVLNMGKESGLWDTMIRTDTELLTKKDLGRRNAKNLNYFDLIIFASTTGELDLDDDQKKDMTLVYPRRWQRIRRNSCGAGYKLQLARIRRDDWRLVRPASLDDVQRADRE